MHQGEREEHVSLGGLNQLVKVFINSLNGLHLFPKPILYPFKRSLEGYESPQFIGAHFYLKACMILNV